VILTHKNFLTYWERMKKGKGFDFVLDAAHFTDYRVQKQQYRVLAKLPDTVSFTVITGKDDFIFDMSELISKKIATMSAPSLGELRLEAMFPNPVRLPFYIQVENSTVAGEMLMKGEVDAAIIPTPLVPRFEGANTVTSTEPVPHMALSASPDIPEVLALKVQKTLIEATNTPEGKKMLETLNLDHFDPATNEDYAGYAQLLEGVFGY
jgi:phosphonate transport system substrate-binding protein